MSRFPRPSKCDGVSDAVVPAPVAVAVADVGSLLSLGCFGMSLASSGGGAVSAVVPIE